MIESEERIRYSDMTTVGSIQQSTRPVGTHPSLIPAENLAPLGCERELCPFARKLQPAFSIDLVDAPSRLPATG
jgi:hypothetical protein